MSTTYDGRLTAIEFYSGIGAFAEAVHHKKPGRCAIQIIAAFDQSEAANRVYATNYGLRPKEFNLDSIRARQLPKADVWWMSPPCKPFTVRGKQLDQSDPRAASLINLIGLIEQAPIQPHFLLLENVAGFVGSNVHTRLLAVLKQQGYAVNECDLDPTLFGVPMRRPRHFLMAAQGGQPPIFPRLQQPTAIPLGEFLQKDLEDERLFLPQEIFNRYQKGFDIVDPHQPGSYLTCFTSGYYRCRKASGSLVDTGDGRARLVSPAEMLKLFGFSEEFVFPPEIDLQTQWRLLGNSVDVRATAYLIGAICSAK